MFIFGNPVYVQLAAERLFFKRRGSKAVMQCKSAWTAVSQTAFSVASFSQAKDCCIRSISFHFVGNKKTALKPF
jgi:hypothetical protein